MAIGIRRSQAAGQVRSVGDGIVEVGGELQEAMEAGGVEVSRVNLNLKVGVATAVQVEQVRRAAPGRIAGVGEHAGGDVGEEAARALWRQERARPAISATQPPGGIRQPTPASKRYEPLPAGEGYRLNAPEL